MDIDRKVYQNGTEEAKRRVGFCLDQVEKDGFAKGIDRDTLLAHSLSIEEVVGALVAAEQALDILETMLVQDEEYGPS